MIDEHERDRILKLRKTFMQHLLKIEEVMVDMVQLLHEARLPQDALALDAIRVVVFHFRSNIGRKFDRNAQVLRATIGEGRPAGG